MSRARSLPPIIMGLTHDGTMQPCLVMTDVAIHTVTLAEGHFAAIVTSDGKGRASVQILDRDDIEAQILLLRNAMEDAERLDAGKAPIHAAPSLVRQ